MLTKRNLTSVAQEAKVNGQEAGAEEDGYIPISIDPRTGSKKIKLIAVFITNHNGEINAISGEFIPIEDSSRLQDDPNILRVINPNEILGGNGKNNINHLIREFT